MLRKSGVDALKALLELALAPETWRSTNELAKAQDLPAPMLEQLLLRLRRAGLIEARRGRQGGYRLARAAALIPIAAVLEAVRLSDTQPPATQDETPADLVTRALEQQLQRSINRTLEQMSLEELLFDWRSAKASQDDDGGLLIV